MHFKNAAGALVALLGVVVSAASHAEGVSCDAQVTRANIAVCALRASPAVVGERHGLAAIEGRRTAASLVFPSNPVLAVTVGRRSSPVEGNGVDWTATLSQDIEIAGQRGARLELVGAEHDAQRARLSGTQREVAAAAYAVYFDALAALEEKKVADRLVDLGSALTRLAQGRAEQGVASDIEADLAYAAATRLAQAQVTAQRHVATTTATLAVALGLDPTKPRPTLEGDLEPLGAANMDAESLVRFALAQRAELLVIDADRRALERRADLYRRSRVPNVTLSIFAISDRVNERILGAGIAVPIPLPAPLGHTYAGEIAESESLAHRAAAETDRLRRAVRLDVLASFENVASRKREIALFSPERIRRADAALVAIARELEAKRIGVRDALLMQQGLVELLQANVEARRQLCLASVELARVSGMILERGAS